MSRPFFIALAGFIVIVVAIGMSIRYGQRDEQGPTPVTKSSQTQGSGNPVETPAAPSFDIVRVNPQGETVIAGRALPKAEVDS